jgi:molybdate transport system substrate-binding protein
LKDGKLVPGSRADLAKSGVAVGVKAGAPKPDISSTEALKKTLLAAKSIGYSTGPSGNIVLRLFERLGVLDRIKPKMKQTPTGVFVGSIIASGDVEIGFQQVSELSQFAGVDYVGPLPADIQEYTTFSSGILKGTKQAEPARALVRFLTAPEAAPIYRKRGMEPG